MGNSDAFGSFDMNTLSKEKIRLKEWLNKSQNHCKADFKENSFETAMQTSKVTPFLPTTENVSNLKPNGSSLFTSPTGMKEIICNSFQHSFVQNTPPVEKHLLKLPDQLIKGTEKYDKASSTPQRKPAVTLQKSQNKEMLFGFG